MNHFKNSKKVDMFIRKLGEEKSNTTNRNLEYKQRVIQSVKNISFDGKTYFNNEIEDKIETYPVV